MGLENRPFIGSWRADGQTIIQHTPDCVITINGYAEIPGCPSCNGRIDIQKYVTAVTVDPSLEPPAGATVTLSIPSVDNQFFFRDGDFLLQPGLEIRIYMRGFFAQKFLTREDADKAGIAAFDPSNYAVYPYYHVFHGVVTEASHGYANGDYSASLTCADVLHFWNNLKVSTNGAVFGVRPDNSLVDPTLVGHTFREASPYSIIYTLFRVGFGAAGGVEFDLNQQSNVAASSAALGTSLYKAAALYWETKWSSRSLNLKMYGADGTLYNGFTQAALSGQTEGLLGNKTVELQAKIASQGNGRDKKGFDTTTSPDILGLIRSLGYNPLSTRVALTTTADGKSQTGIDVTKMQAFILDLSAIGNVNLFETEYASKMEIVEAVKQITGFEFYQDVDGSLVFKPPFYNLDTSTDPVYVIEDSALISISESSKEPEVTMVKVKGSAYQPNVNMGLEAWIIPTAIFIDYRLVAQFGWRDQTFECNYLTDTRSLYLTAINRLDLLNVAAKSATITIPLRPEIRPGYPVYIQFIDSYYYITSMSHSFTVGGNCTTTLQGVAKRSKFNAPGVPPGTREPSVSDIRLDNLYLPAVPLYVKTQDYSNVNRGSAEFQAQQFAASGPLRHQGFPNVVMAISPESVNIASTFELTAESPDSIIQTALDAGVLVVSPTALGATDQQKREQGPFLVLTGNEDQQGKEFTRAQLIECYDENNRTVNPTSTLGVIIQAVKTTITYGSPVKNYLNLVKNNRASFAPGTGVNAEYRYYSCSHPDPAQQGVTGVDVSIGKSDRFSIPAGTSPQSRTSGFLPNGGYGELTVRRGIPISFEYVGEDREIATKTASVATKDIYSVSFMRNYTVRSIPTQKQVQNNLANLNLLTEGVLDLLKSVLLGGVGDSSDSMSERMSEPYLSVVAPLKTYIQTAGGGEPVVIPPTYDDFIRYQFDIWSEGLKADPAPTPPIVINSTKTLRWNVDAQYPLSAGQTYNDDAWFRRYVDAPDIGVAGTLFAIALSPTLQLLRALQRAYAANPYDENANMKADTVRTALNTLTDRLTPLATYLPVNYAESHQVGAFSLEKDPRTDYTPVYPVSDAAGYEVYGVFPYGRGLNVATFVDMMQTEGAFFAGITTSTSLAAVEAFLSAYRANKGDVAQAIAGVDPTLKSQLYELVSDADTVVRDDAGFVAQIKEQRQTVENSPATQNKILASNIPTQLAEITVGEDQLCSCKTFDAQIYLLAATLDPLTYRPVTALWQENKDAYAGEALDIRSQNLAQYFEPFQADSSRFFANPAVAAAQGIFDALGGVANAAESIRNAADQLKPNRNGSGEGG